MRDERETRVPPKDTHEHCCKGYAAIIALSIHIVQAIDR
jgi:hypothetical protein